MKTIMISVLTICVMLADAVWAAQYPNTNSPLGTNVAAIADWNSELYFFDVARCWRGWENHGVTEGLMPPEQVDESGYPKYVNPDQNITIGWLNQSKPAGKYLVTWDGEATFTEHRQGPNACQIVERGNNWLVINGIAKEWWGLRLTSTNPNNHIRNLHIYAPGFWDEATHALKPGHDANNPWHPEYLKTLSRFSTIRFLDWMPINIDPEETRKYGVPVEWKDLKPANWWTWVSDGSAVHFHKYRHTGPAPCIRLCNALHANCWLPVPHRLSDNAVRKLAEYVRDNLNPDLEVIVEYGNECWNWGAAWAVPTQYCVDKSRELGIGDWGDGYYALRSIQIWKIFNDVFGNRANKVKKVLSWQRGSTYGFNLMYSLVIDKPQWNPNNIRPDYLAWAPYFSNFNPEGAKISPSIGLEPFMDEVINKIVPLNCTEMAELARYAAQRGAKPVCYEAGQHFFPGSPQDVEFYASVNRHPKMKPACINYLNTWLKHSNNGLMCWWQSTGLWGQYGYWGFKEYWNQPRSEAPKYDAIMTVIEEVAGPAPAVSSP